MKQVNQTTVAIDLAKRTAALTMQWDFSLREGREQLGKRFEAWRRCEIGGSSIAPHDCPNLIGFYEREEAIAYGQLEVCVEFWNRYTE